MVESRDRSVYVQIKWNKGTILIIIIRQSEKLSSTKKSKVGGYISVS